MHSVIASIEDLKVKLSDASNKNFQYFSLILIYSLLDQLESSVNKLIDGMKFAYEAALI